MPTLKMIEYDSVHHFPLPIIELHIRGEKHYFVVDTGAMETIINIELASRFLTERTLQNRTPNHIGGIGGSAMNSFISHTTCNFIGVSIPQVTFLEGEVFYRIASCRIISGIIGQDILQQFDAVEFDFKAKLIRFKKA